MDEKLSSYQEFLKSHQQNTKGKKKEDTNKIFIFIVSICVLLVLAFVIFLLQKVIQHNASNHGILQSNKPLPKITTIVLTNTGFSPQDITIGKGTAVQWINHTSTDNASVNSDDYPTNRLYPELNLGKFSKGSTLVHIFNTLGTYTYHNQFNPKQAGTVIVE